MNEELLVEQPDCEPLWHVQFFCQPPSYLAIADRQGAWRVQATADSQERARALILGMMQMVDLDPQRVRAS